MLFTERVGRTYTYSPSGMGRPAITLVLHPSSDTHRPPNRMMVGAATYRATTGHNLTPKGLTVGGFDHDRHQCAVVWPLGLEGSKGKND
jgi:hypothetical protein